ncbi:glycosyl hydrolase family 16 [Fusarium mexicanum]|uniref:Glycosyl hydrolase family 16 n=1 Tax=Fusarium mexicanum TaxID=751941 RepID=A0A8H5J7D2_9HYPO|nr:glycosyl hydrolase family 16 [Fusarium mexicanum]
MLPEISILGLALVVAGVQAAIPKIPGFRVTWADDFDGPNNALPNHSKWLIDTGTSYPGGPPAWGTGEVQTYMDRTENIRTNGKGTLLITALKNSENWTSARIETRRENFLAQPGGKMRIQADLRLPSLGGNSIGYWAAFKTLGAEYRGNFRNWPAVGEIDIMENVNNLDRTWSVLHCGTNPHGPCDEPNGLASSRACPGSSCAGNFHTHTVEIDRSMHPETVRWFVDGVQYHQVNETEIPMKVWEQTIHRPHFILLNLAIGGEFTDGVFGGQTPLETTVSGGRYEIRYVAVYNTIGDHV